MPLSKKRNKERMRLLRDNVQPACNLNTPQNVQPNEVDNKSQRLALAREVLKNVQSANTLMELPIYNPTLHRSGDKVRIFQFGKWRAITIPELDKDGYPIPSY